MSEEGWERLLPLKDTEGPQARRAGDLKDREGVEMDTPQSFHPQPMDTLILAQCHHFRLESCRAEVIAVSGHLCAVICGHSCRTSQAITLPFCT